MRNRLFGIRKFCACLDCDWWPFLSASRPGAAGLIRALLYVVRNLARFCRRRSSFRGRPGLRVDMENRGRQAAWARQQARQARRQASILTIADHEKQTLHIGDETLGLEGLAFEPLLLTGPQRHPR